MVIPFRIHQIKTIQFAIFPELLISQEQVSFKSGVSFGVNKEMTSIRCNTKITYTQEERLLLVIEVSCYFDIEKNAGKQILEVNRIDVGFLRYLATITIGTLRGIIHAKTEGTVLNPIVLPPINLDVIIDKDLVLSDS